LVKQPENLCNHRLVSISSEMQTIRLDLPSVQVPSCSTLAASSVQAMNLSYWLHTHLILLQMSLIETRLSRVSDPKQRPQGIYGCQQLCRVPTERVSMAGSKPSAPPVDISQTLKRTKGGRVSYLLYPEPVYMSCEPANSVRKWAGSRD